MPIGAAIAVGSVASAGIGALAASSAASKQSSAATQAATIQSNAANRAADIQLGMFNTIRGDLTPYRVAGGAALPGYMAMLGIPTGSGATTTSATPMTAAAPSAFDAGQFAAPSGPNWDAYMQAYPDVMAEYQRVNGPGLAQALGLSNDKTAGLTPAQFAQWHYNTKGQAEGRTVANYDAPAAQTATAGGPTAGTPAAAAPTFDPAAMQTFLENTPGYQFTRDQGMQSVENQLAARGLGGLSGALGKGLARFVTGLADQTYQSQLDNYRTAAGMGQSAANQTGTFGQAATSGAASSLVGGANAQAAGITGAAQAGASGMVGAANALSGGVQGAANGLLTSRVLGMYSPAAAAPAYASTPIASEPWYAEG